MINVKFMLGADADRYEETGKVPTSKYVNEHGGQLLTRIYCTKAEYTAYAKILRDTCPDNFASHIVSDTTASDGEGTKELYAFVFPATRLPRNATDAQILAAWNAESDNYTIDKLTPDELAAPLNDDNAGFSKQWVRFIHC